MRNQLLIIICLFLFPVSAIAGGKHETFLNAGKQVLFFYPVTLKSDDGSMKLEYDFTHQEKTDSITLNFSIISKNAAKIGDIAIKGNSESINPRYKKQLYRDLIKNKYITRMQTSFIYSEFERLFRESSTIKFAIVINGDVVYFEFSPKQLHQAKKEINMLNNLFE